MALDEKLATDIAVTTAINLAQKIRGLAFIPLLTVLLGPAAYGAFIQVTLISRIISAIVSLGLDRGLVRFMQPLQRRTEKAELYYSLLSVGLVSGIIASIMLAISAAHVSALTLQSTAYSTVFFIGSALIPVYIAQEIGRNFFRAEMRVKLFSILDGVKVYLEVGTITVVVWLLGYGLVEMFYVLVAVETLFVTTIQVAIISQLGLTKPTLRGLSDHLNWSLPVMITEVSGMAQDRADRLLIGFFLGPAAVGIYSVAYTVARLIRLFALPLRVTFFAELSRLWENDERKESRRILRNGTRYFTMLSVPSVAGLYLIGPGLLSTLSTSDVADSAVPLLPVLASAIMLIGGETIYRQLFYAAEDTTIVSVVRLIATILNIALNILLIPVFGIIGAAVTTLATFGISFVTIFIFARYRYNVSAPFGFISRTLIATAIMTGLVFGLHISHFVVILFIAPIIYFVTLFAIGGFYERDIDFIVSFVRSMWS